MNTIGNGFSSIEQVTNQYLNQNQSPAKTTEATGSFEEILKKQLTSEETSTLKFSKHASMRLDDRNISLSQEQSQRLETGVKLAGEKGINESLVLMDSMAFIVNIPNQTVVTALDSKESMSNVFTNIDGAVIV